jgi:hypothetical protein
MRVFLVPRKQYSPSLIDRVGASGGGAARRGRLRPGAPGCRLFWQGEERLYVAWGDAVRVGAVAAAPRGGGAGGGEPRRALEVVATLQMDCLVAVRPWSA